MLSFHIPHAEHGKIAHTDVDTLRLVQDRQPHLVTADRRKGLSIEEINLELIVAQEYKNAIAI